MNRRQIIFLIFLICLILTGIIYFLGKNAGVIVQFIFSPVQKTIIQASQIFIVPTSRLQQENIRLTQEVTKMRLVQADNVSLRDQFQTTTPSSHTLIPAEIVGKPSFLPGVSAPEAYVIGIGKANGISINTPIVYKDTLVGKIVEANNHFSKVEIISNKHTSFTAKTSQTGAIGIIKGQGDGGVTLENVLLSDTLQVGDTVVTSGETDVDGHGYPPGLIIGKITSVEKNPSSLFQKASVAPLLNFNTLLMVFALVQK